jgi:hypothetical protein
MADIRRLFSVLSRLRGEAPPPPKTRTRASVPPTTPKPVTRVASPPRASRRPVATSTYEATPFVAGRHRTDVTSASPAVREAFTSDPLSTWTTPEGTDIIHGALGLQSRATVPATGVYQPPVAGALPESNPARGARVAMEGYDISPEDAAAMTAGEAVRAVGDVQGAGAWSMPVAVNDLRRSGSLIIPTERPTDIKRLLALKSLGMPYGLTDVVDLGRGVGMTAFYPNTPPGGRQTLAALDQSNLAEDIYNLIGNTPRMVDWKSGYAGFEDPWQAPEFSGAVTRELQDYLEPLRQANRERYEGMLDDPAIAEAFGRRYQRDEAARLLGAPVRADVQEARQRIADKARLRELLDAYRRGVPTMAEGGHVHAQ